MLAGDFTAFTSPQCNGGRQVALRAPYVNNRIDPALFSPAALNIAKRLPSTTDPCGQITFDVKGDRDEKQTLARIDYQASAKHSFFGRYFLTRFTQPSGYAGGSDNVLKTVNQGANDWSHSLTLRRDNGAQLVDRQLAAVRGEQGDGRQLPDAVLLAEGHRRKRLQLRPGIHGVERAPAASRCIRPTRRGRSSITTPTSWART